MRILAAPAFTNEKINPYNALLYREINKILPAVEEYSHQKALTQKIDIIHFHWPDGYINQSGLLKTLQRIFVLACVIIIAKIKSARIIWTVHNIFPHDAYHPQLSASFMHWFAKRCDGLIFMSEPSQKAFFGLYNLHKIPHQAIIPHGHYRESYHVPIDQQHAKQQLGLADNKQVLLAFGMIKPYKNIDTLIKAFNQAQPENTLLVIAGNPESRQLADSLLKLKGDNQNIHLFLTFIADEQLPVFLSAADIVILPYKNIFNSGALLLALSFNKPVIAPRIGAFITLQKELGTQWIHCYDETLNSGTLQYATHYLQQQFRPPICPLDNYNWDHLANKTLKFYQEVL